MVQFMWRYLRQSTFSLRTHYQIFSLSLPTTPCPKEVFLGVRAEGDMVEKTLNGQGKWGNYLCLLILNSPSLLIFPSHKILILFEVLWWPFDPQKSSFSEVTMFFWITDHHIYWPTGTVHIFLVTESLFIQFCLGYPLQYSWVSTVTQWVKNPPAMWETWVWFLGWDDPLEKGKATHSTILAWRIPWTV